MPTAPAYNSTLGINAANGSNSRTSNFTPVAGRFGILQVFGEGTTNDINTPAGWNDFGTSFLKAGASYTVYGKWFWRRIDGTETGVTWTRTSSTGLFAGIVSFWTGVVATGTPLEYVGPATGNSATVSSTSITPSVDYCRVVNMTTFGDNYNIATLGGGNYVENFDSVTGAGIGCGLSCCSFAQTTAANEPARTGASGGSPSSDPWGTITFALYPVAASGWSHKLNGIAAANIAKVNGIAIASVSKIKGVA